LTIILEANDAALLAAALGEIGRARGMAEIAKAAGASIGKPYIKLYARAGLNRPRPSETDPPSFLHWTTPSLPHDLDFVGPIELRLEAACSAPDIAFIAVLQDVDQEENAVNITSGYL
jgi:hypothetical protein